MGLYKVEFHSSYLSLCTPNNVLSLLNAIIHSVYIGVTSEARETISAYAPNIAAFFFLRLFTRATMAPRTKEVILCRGYILDFSHHIILLAVMDKKT